MQITAGDLVEATTVSNKPRTIRVRVHHAPWGDDHSTVVSDGTGAVSVLTDSMRVIEGDEPPADPRLQRCGICGGPVAALSCRRD